MVCLVRLVRNRASNWNGMVRAVLSLVVCIFAVISLTSCGSVFHSPHAIINLSARLVVIDAHAAEEESVWWGGVVHHAWSKVSFLRAWFIVCVCVFFKPKQIQSKLQPHIINHQSFRPFSHTKPTDYILIFNLKSTARKSGLNVSPIIAD